MTKKILIVDDETLITKLTRRRLEEAGYECDECWNGSSALEMIKSTKPDIVLLDYAMPVMKGDEVCREIREDVNFKDLPVIMLTAHTTKEAADLKEEGATDVMYKPIDEEDLLSMLEKHIGKP
jgi:CheY-like chemotaxis protein